MSIELKSLKFIASSLKDSKFAPLNPELLYLNDPKSRLRGVFKFYFWSREFDVVIKKFNQIYGRIA